MDWRRTRKAWSVFVRRCEEIEQIASTRSFCPSRRRWSDWIQKFGTNVYLTVRAFATLINSTMVESCAKRKRSRKESPLLLGSKLIRDNPLPLSSSRTFRRKSDWSGIARQRDVTQRAHLPRWKFPRPALHGPVKIDYWWKRVQRRETRCSPRPLISRVRIYTNTGRTTWPNSDFQFTSRRGNTSKYSVLGQYLHNAPPASCIEKLVAINSEVVLYNKVHEASRSPLKVALRLAWPEGRQDTTNSEGRKSSAISGKDRETCCRSTIAIRFQKLNTEIKVWLIPQWNKTTIHVK